METMKIESIKPGMTIKVGSQWRKVLSVDVAANEISTLKPKSGKAWLAIFHPGDDITVKQ